MVNKNKRKNSSINYILFGLIILIAIVIIVLIIKIKHINQKN